MKFVIITQGDIIYTPAFFKKFFSQPYKGECMGVMVQSALGNKSYVDLIKRMYSFYGLKDFLKQGFRFALKKIRAKLYDVNILSEPVSIENVAQHYGVSVLPFESVNTKNFKKWVSEREIDLIVSIAASELFGKEILELPPLGCINFHNAPLPYYRGMLPNFWQMYYDETHSILTVHTMTEELDKGQIIYQNKTVIKPEYSLEDLIMLTKKKSADALAEVLQQFEAGEVRYRPMPDAEGSYFTFPIRSDVEQFKSKNKKLF